MNRAAEILAGVERALLSDAGAFLQGDANLARSLARVSDEDLRACAGSFLLSDALRFERARREGKVVEWGVAFEVDFEVVKISYAVRPTATLRSIVMMTEVAS